MQLKLRRFFASPVKSAKGPVSRFWAVLPVDKGNGQYESDASFVNFYMRPSSEDKSLMGYYKRPKTCMHNVQSSCNLSIVWRLEESPEKRVRFEVIVRGAQQITVGFSYRHSTVNSEYFTCNLKKGFEHGYIDSKKKKSVDVNGVTFMGRCQLSGGNVVTSFAKDLNSSRGSEILLSTRLGVHLYHSQNTPGPGMKETFLPVPVRFDLFSPSQILNQPNTVNHIVHSFDPPKAHVLQTVRQFSGYRSTGTGNVATAVGTAAEDNDRPQTEGVSDDLPVAMDESPKSMSGLIQALQQALQKFSKSESS